jgi:flagellar motor switch protein FliN/FliY
MTDDSNLNQTDPAETAAQNGQETLNNMPLEDMQSSGPTLMDFSAPPDPNQINDAGKGSGGDSGDNISMLMDVNLQFTVELGRTQMPVRQILELQSGSVVELDRIAGEAVDVFINEHLMARGEVVVVDDKFGVRITELISPTKGK